MNFPAFFFLGCALAFTSIPTAAQLGPIIITPTRTPQTENNSSATVYVVTRAEIEASGAVTTSQLLRGIPGIQIDDLFGNGTDVTISVRGFSSTANANTLVLVNGRRLNHSDTASPDIHHIFPKDIERIEVMVGSAGGLYGDQAVGGVINLITRRPGEDYRQLSLRTGSFGYRGVEFNASGQATSVLGYRLSAETFEADHYRDHNAEENSNIDAVLEYTRQADTFLIELQRIEDELELPGALLENEFEDDPTQVNPGFAGDFLNEDTSVFRLGYERDLGNHRLNIDTAFRKTDADLRQSFRNNPSPADGSIEREHRSINPKISGMLPVALETAYVLGIDLETTDFDSEIPNVFFVSESANRQEIDSLYFQLAPRLTEAAQLTFGMRHSALENELHYFDFDIPSTEVDTEVDDDITVAEIGLAYLVDDRTRLSVRYDENFRFAKIDEFSGTIAPTILDTQTGESIELGLDMTRGKHRFVLSLYRLDLEDEIVFDPSAGPDFGFGPTGLNVNLDQTRRDGLTLSWLSEVSPGLSVKTEIGLVDARFASGTFDGNEISGVADEIASLRANLQVNDYLSTFAEVHYTGERFAQGDNGNDFGKLDSITVINAGLGYRFQSWNATLRINNLADKEYAEFITNNGFGAAFQPSPGRNAMLSLSYRFE